MKNAAAWETLNKDNEKKHGQSPDGSNAVEAKSDGDLAKPPNNSHGSLWSEFQSKELKMKAMVRLQPSVVYGVIHCNCSDCQSL